MRMRAKRPPLIVTERAAPRLVAGLPVSVLHHRFAGRRARERAGRAPGREQAGSGGPPPAPWEEVSCVDSLERLGVRTLGELAALPADAIADRFGEPGLWALRLARGADDPLRPRSPREQLVERLELPESASGQQLERSLELLVERLLAHPARAGRTIRRLRLEARLAAGGGWRSEVVLRSASSEAERLRLALAPRLGDLPGPAAVIGLRALELGPQAGDQASLRSPASERRGRLAEAVRQARAAAGRDAVLQVIEVDPRSRVPERRAILTPFPERADDR
jgi:protein ImuB